jgi:hypothetical protein
MILERIDTREQLQRQPPLRQPPPRRVTNDDGKLSFVISCYFLILELDGDEEIAQIQARLKELIV